MNAPGDVAPWVAKAEEDFVIAESCLRRKKPLTYGACFHAQQCAEKYLKAALVASGSAFPKTHDLIMLSEMCSRAGVSIGMDAKRLHLLADAGVRVRYPGEDPTLVEAQRALEVAKAVRRSVRRWLAVR